MSGMVIVCGGRDYDDRENVRRILRSECPGGWIVIQGGARGADTLAHEEAQKLGNYSVTAHANWKSFGNSAGVIRNRVMLDLGPEKVIAFPGGRGTAHMVSIAKQAGVPVVEVSP